MDEPSVNPDPAFSEILLSIRRDPASWDKWSCLSLSLQNHLWGKNSERIESCIRSNFGHLDGRIFMMQDQIYIVCRNIQAHILNDLGRQICKIRIDGRTVFQSHGAFNLGADADMFLSGFPAWDMSGCIMEVSKKISSGSGKDKRVLLVDDDPVSCRLVSNILSGKYGFASAASGGRAFELYETWRPDIVFLDIGLPDRDGFSVLRWIKRKDPDANIIMFSGRGDLASIASAFDQGAKGFISKPFRPDKILHYIEKDLHEVFTSGG